MLKATRNIPLQTRDEVNERMLRGGIESGIAQVVGLAYSSTSEASWLPAKCSRVQIPLDFGCWYQYLPIGTTRETAKRINVRFDVYDVGVPPDGLFEGYWNSYSKERYINDHAKPESELKRSSLANTICSTDDTMDVLVEEIVPNTKVDVSHVARFIKVSTPKKNPTKVGAMALVTKKVKMFPAAFHRHRDSEDPTRAEEVWCRCKRLICIVHAALGARHLQDQLRYWTVTRRL